jgi:hypothetical protein
MAFGLQIFSETGQVDFDSTSWKILRHIQTSVVGLAGAGGTVYLYVPGMTADPIGAGFVIFVDKVWAYAMGFTTDYISFYTGTNSLNIGGRSITVTIMRYK